MQSEVPNQFFRLSDRQKNLFRLCGLGIFTGVMGGYWLIAQAMPAPPNQACLTSYSQQVGAIAFDAMKECNLR